MSDDTTHSRQWERRSKKYRRDLAEIREQLEETLDYIDDALRKENR